MAESSTNKETLFSAQHTPAQRVTSVLLNGRNFASWARSLRLYEGLNLSVTDYFGYLRSRWEELAQYEPLSEFPFEVASLLVKRLDRQHTYQFLMGLRPEFEPLKSQILNASPMPSLLEAFATVNGEARRHCLIQPSIVLVPVSEPAWDGTPTAFHVKAKQPTWVLDSGANDHMTGELSVFSFNVIPVTQSMYLADGSTSYIHSKGDVCLSPDITLSSVLHDLCSKRIFGRGYERDGLYYFGEPPGMSLQASVLPTSSIYDVSFRTFSLWHARLGHFLQMIKTRYNIVVRNIRSDNGREYVSNEFWSELNKKGILHQLTCPYTLEQNGVAERKNCHLMSVVRCLLSGMHVPKFYWHMAILIAVFLINRTPSRVLGGKVALQILQPDYTLFHLLPCVFGCTCFVHNRSPSHHKLDDKSIRCIFLGYYAMSKGYRCYDPMTKHMYHSLDMTFHEIVPFYSTNSMVHDSLSCDLEKEISFIARPVPLFENETVLESHSPSMQGSPPLLQVYSRRHRTQPPLPESSSIPGSGNSPSLIAPIILERTSRYPTRDRHPPNWYGFSSNTNHPISQYVSYDGLSGAYKSFLGKIGTIFIPRSVSEAFQDPN
ncbi:uncharacterized protein LOC132270389 [Cornus florida]|uniref:uncharacterized protein LOC132270389 n=1 Tax=Cornus florida TaxID=4283 RepID=UPI00289BCE78|nr:uncharacterized protein LOC132270389 [Cornus florida]